MSIFSYDKEARCDWCESGLEGEDGFVCKKGFEPLTCKEYKYDVFKRKPNQSPKFQKFDPKDFII